MANSYAPTTPVGKQNDIKVGYPPAQIGLAATNKENASTSSVLQFTHNTTEIEVTAVGGPAAMKWATSIANNGTSVIAAAGTANFDHIIPASTTRRFVVPIQSAANYASIMGVNRQEGLYQGVAFISAGAASSVLTIEY